MAEIREVLDLWKAFKWGAWSAPVRKCAIGMCERWVKEFVLPVGEAQLTSYFMKRQEGCRAGSLNTERSYLGQFFEFCVRVEKMPRNPISAWPRCRAEIQEAPVAFTKAEIARLVEGATALWLKDLIVIGAYLGIRVGTIAKLEVGMVDPRGEALEIPKSLCKNREGLRLPLVGKAREVLVRRRVGSRESLIFRDLPSRPEMWRRFKRLAREILGQEATLHDLRRTYCALLFAAQVPLARALELGGWKSQSVLLRHYYSQMPVEEARGWMEKVAE